MRRYPFVLGLGLCIISQLGVEQANTDVLDVQLVPAEVPYV